MKTSHRKKKDLKIKSIKLFIFSKREETIHQRIFNYLKILKNCPDIFQNIVVSFENTIKSIRTKLSSMEANLDNIEKYFIDVFKKNPQTIKSLTK